MTPGIEAVGLLFDLVGVGVLTAIFYRLGGLGARLDAHEHRITKLEGETC